MQEYDTCTISTVPLCVVNGKVRIEYVDFGIIDLTSGREYFSTAPFQSDINIHLFYLYKDYSPSANTCQI